MFTLYAKQMNPQLNGLMLLLLITATALIQGCTQHHSLVGPQNPSKKFHGTPNEMGDRFIHMDAAKTTFSSDLDCSLFRDVAAPLNYRSDKPILKTSAANAPLFIPEIASEKGLPLSPGDLIEVIIEDGEGFNGRYVINNSGFLTLPFIAPIISAGLNVRQISEKVELALVKADIFQASAINVNLQVLNYAAIEVSVSGAVFQPGRVLINDKRPSQLMEERTTAYGDFSTKRLLSEAVRAASGVRPDAKLDQVIIIRNGWQIEADMTGILSGEAVTDYSLIAGDRVIVPSTGCFQAHLVRPSQITPKGFRVFMSNLIDSAYNNSSAAVGRYSTNIPYGTRLLQAAVSANCVGGKEWTNAPRKILLASLNPITQETQVIERSVEQLMRMPHREEINPYLMPNDAVACYDSNITNLRDIAKTIVDIISPLRLF